MFRWIIAGLGGAVIVVLILLFIQYTIGWGNRALGPEPANIDIVRDTDTADDAHPCCGRYEKIILRASEPQTRSPLPPLCSDCVVVNGIPGVQGEIQIYRGRLVFPKREPADVPGVEPPGMSGNVTGADFCGRLIHQPLPRVPQSGGNSGELLAVFDVEADGTVSNIRIRNATSPIWRREVIRALKDWRYEAYRPAAPDDPCRPPFRDLRMVFEYRITEPQ